MSNDQKKAALDYHELPRPGKISVEITKSTTTQHDLAMAYSPGVAEPVRAIAEDPENAYRFTSKGNLVGVITDGTAILGLGNLGALASKPVMEGKGVLFKKFAGIDVFDIEVNSESSQAFIETVVRMAPTFGGINLEDIKGPECFEIEQAIASKLDIPVFHDDQHGTAIIISAGLLNALEVQKKQLSDCKIVIVGAGAAGIAAGHLLRALGMPKQNLLMVDSRGVIHSGRSDLNAYKHAFAVDSECRTLADAMKDADVFIGVSGPNILKAEMLASMADRPVVFALSNPDPEISPELAHQTRDDLIMATGRSDYPNQVNNVLCFPFLFRGALDVRASKINREMQIAAVHAIRNLAKEEVPAEVLQAYGVEKMEFGRDYIIPTPLDLRLIDVVSPAVAQAAIDTGVAQLDYPYSQFPPSHIFCR
ncbi:malic enzyme-like NAD(P)-binding protein [Pelagibaculum spongiae]|uniref:NADP-dependent malic enzyme n=1 Tax=Pelagibaculum spongiae TaxID=2080658 RepID=A0A2V1GYY7_9GAMM|nr:malic enzyme-like NAD(P)-binding protein [Pelagibaculum spongiae]PVZ68266.1 malate dehydrogenase [Pelagibaculum spongiae]